jgi:hypothetical protein
MQVSLTNSVGSDSHNIWIRFWGARHHFNGLMDINPTIIRECRIVPVAENDGLLTVASDFADIEMIEKTRFITNTDFLVVYADPHHIDSLIENHL